MRSIANREDVCIFTFPVGADDVDEAMERIVAKIKHAAKQGREPEPLLRVIPLDNRTIYDEALSLTMEKTTREDGAAAAWIVSSERAELAFRPKPREDNAEVPEIVWTIRVLQRLLN
jgi:hypothetical protein